MDTLHFDGRDISPHAEYVNGGDLIEGQTYFAVHFVDEEMLTPEVRPLVFIGRDREPGVVGMVYFQDAASYLAGLRWGEPGRDVEPHEFHTVREGTPFVFEYERALDRLLACSLRRSRNRR